MTMTDAELAEIRARLDKATPGPWTVDADAGDWETDPYCHVSGWTDNGEDWMCLDHDDAAFIAHARQDVPALLDELAAARELLREAESWVMRGWQRDRIVAFLHSATEDADTTGKET